MVAAGAAGSCDGHKAKRGNEPGWPSWCPASPQECRIRSHWRKRRRAITTPPTIAPPAANTKPKSQAAEPSPAASAPAGTARGTGWHAMGRNKSLNESTSCGTAVPAVEIFLLSLARVVVYLIDISGHELVHCEDTSLLVFGELAAEVVGGPGVERTSIW